MSTKTKTQGLALLIVLLLVAWYALSHTATKPAPISPSTTTTNSAATPISQAPLKVTKTDVPPAQSPQGFPSDIPIEKGAQITQNYNATAANGLVQATRTFITKQSLAANFTLYSDYLNKNGWTTVNSLNLSTTKVLSAKKSSASLQITMSQNSITNVNTVDISYTSGQ